MLAWGIVSPGGPVRYRTEKPVGMGACAPNSKREVEDQYAVGAARRHADPRADGAMARIIEIGIARCDIGEIGDKALGKALPQAFGTDIWAGLEGQQARQRVAQRVEIGIKLVALGAGNCIAKTQEYAVPDYHFFLKNGGDGDAGAIGC